MMDVVHLIAAAEDGRHESIVLEIDDSGESSIKMTRSSKVVSVHPGRDLFECLKDVRRIFEAEDLLVCCQGSRPMVFPSGMGRQMSNGRLAYPLRRTPPLTDADLVDIFAAAHFSEVGTIGEQRQAVLNFSASLQG
jgi:hypothetical protein